MSLNVTFNGSVYIVPETGEVGWGGNTTSYLVAIAAGALQKTGGNFTLSADTDFGASFGLKSLYYKSRNSNVAASGIVRLNNNSDAISWRNAANNADLPLIVDASNNLSFNGGVVYTIGTGSITNSDINASAAIAFSKMAAMSANRMTRTNASGFIEATSWSIDAGSTVTTGPESELRFQDNSGGDYVSIKAPSAVTTHGYALPVAPGTAGQVLSWQAGGQLQWISAPGTGTINTGTAGSFAYYPATGTTLDDQPVISTDGTNLAVAGQIQAPVGSAVAPSYTFTGDTNTGVYQHIADGVAITTAGLPRLRVNADGKVGIGPVISGAADDAPFNVFQDGLNSRPGMQIMTKNTLFSRVPVAIYQNFDAAANAVGNCLAFYGRDGVTDIQHGILAYSQAGVTTSEARFELFLRSNADSLPVIQSKGTGIKGYANTVFGPNEAAPGEFAASYPYGAYDPSSTVHVATDTGDVDSGIRLDSRRYSTRYNFFIESSGNMVIRDVDTVAAAIKILPVSGQFQTPSGSATIPAYSFTNDPNTGMYNPAGDSIAFTTNGAVKLTIDSGGTSTFVESIREKDGSVGSPSYTFSNAATTGLYKSGTNEMGFTSNGTAVWATNVTDGIFPATTNTYKLGKSGNVWSEVWTLALRNSGGVDIEGTNTNDTAASGYVGEHVSSAVGTTAFPTSAEYGDLTSISLTAGDWDVSCLLYATTNGATVTQISAGISITSGNSATGLVLGDSETLGLPPTASSDAGAAVPSLRMSFSSTTTVYFKFKANYSVATPNARGRISARRVR